MSLFYNIHDHIVAVALGRPQRHIRKIAAYDYQQSKSRPEEIGSAEWIGWMLFDATYVH